MTWSVENLFLPGDDAGPDTQATFDRKTASLAAVTDAQAPDILALQEVGPPDALDHLRGALTRHLPHAELGDPDDRSIRVALLSTRPLEDPTRIRTLPEQVRPIQVRDPVWDNDATTDQMGRGALAATVTVDGTPVTVVTAHLKSKLISYPPPKPASSPAPSGNPTTRANACATPGTPSTCAPPKP